MDVGHEEAYRSGYRYLRSIIDPLTEAQLQTTCPHCPEWTLKDVLAHLMAVIETTVNEAGPKGFRKRVIESIINSDPVEREAAGIDRDRFWNDLVASLRPLTMDELHGRWDVALDDLAPDQWSVVDFAVHVGDIEEAIGVSASWQMDMHALSLERYSELLVRHLEASGVPTIALQGSDPNLSAGDSSATHLVQGSTYELLRTVTGRRSLSEARELLDWSSTPGETQAIFPIYDWLPKSLRNATIL